MTAPLIERFDHLSIATWSIASVLPLVEVMGGSFRKGGLNAGGGFLWAQFALDGSGTLEVIQPCDPDDGDHFLVRFLTMRGEGVHHVTVKVSDIDLAIADARRRGFEVVGIDAGGGWKEAFIHPKSAHGVLVQLAEWTEAADAGGWTLDELIEGACS